MIDQNAPFRAAPRITRADFATIIQRDANPALAMERDPGEYFDAIAAYGVDPLFLLAMFNHESTLGKAGTAMTTHSWGNTRDPSFGATPTREIAGRSGTFPVFATWLDGAKSTAARLVEPTWVYADRTRIIDIFDWPAAPDKVWAPAGDLNDPAGYVRAVLDYMNAHANPQQTGGAPVAGDDPRFQWLPETAGEFGYPTGAHGRGGHVIELLILHITAGTDSLAWLRGGNQSSVHYLTDTAGKPRAQMIAEADAAWTAGSSEYNQRGINIEVEMLHETDWTDAIMREVARTVAPIMQRNGIPAVYLGRDNGAGKRGMIGHRDVPDGTGGWGGSSHHTDPGAGFDWPAFVGYVTAEMTGSTPTQPQQPADSLAVGDVVLDRHADANPYGKFYVPVDFDADISRDEFIDVGYCRSGAFVEDNKLVQYFERRRYERQSDGTLTYGLLGNEVFAARYPNGQP